MIKTKDKFWFLLINSFLGAGVGAFLKVATNNPNANYVLFASLFLFLLALLILVKQYRSKTNNQ